MMRKCLRFLILLVVALAFIPVKAYAWDFLPDGQMWAGDVDGNHCATVHAGEIYDAATYAVGSDPNKVSASVRVKLSDPNYGGRFYEYAQTFHKMESWDDYPEWLPAYVGVAQMITNGLIGDFNIYNSEASISLYEGAMIDFRRVLAGDDLSGGGASGDGTSYAGSYAGLTIRAFASQATPQTSVATNAYFDDGVVVPTGGTTTFSAYRNSSFYFDTARIYISSGVTQLINSYISQGYDVVILAGRFIYGHNLSVQYGRIFNNYCNYVSGSDAHIVRFCNDLWYHDADGIFTFGADFSSDDVIVSSISLPDTFLFMSNVYDSPLEVPSAPLPDGDWPEPSTPVTPDPPEVPSPTAPTVTPDPTPTEPIVVWPTGPTVVNPPEVTVEVTPSELDYTELLTRINDNLNSIDSYTQAINASLNSLRADVLDGFDDVVTSIRNVYRYLQHLNEVLEVHCKHIRDSIDDNVYELELYLKSLLHWLADQLSYDELYTYDDSAVTTLLYRILNKIPGGNGPVTYKPNPQSDEPGFFDWLTDLWHRFLIDLVSVLPDELGGLVNAFSQLTHYFPFSIPWDLFALFALFEHEPVTPVFDIPWGYGGESGDVQMIRIDLSVWDGVMSMIRPVFIVGFCFKLAMITKDLLSNFDINKGGI